MEKQRLIYLLQQYGNDHATEEELHELQQFLSSDEGRDLFADVMPGLMTAQTNTHFDITPYLDLSKKVLDIDKSPEPYTLPQPAHRVHFLRTAWFRYAAAIILVLGVAAYFGIINNKKDTVAANEGKPPATDIPPGKNGAILTLADGRQLVLDSLANGVVATQNGSRAILQNGSLTYDADNRSTGNMVYNTVSTPNGRQFRLILPDGSKVWLNAASSIKYPTVFTGEKRRVELTGEAYFEVVHNAKKPFWVSLSAPRGAGGERAVEVLGTSFNINSYDNESVITTTLIKGSVRLRANSNEQVLKPGEQALTFPDETIKVAANADVDQVLAWKNGYFDFTNAGLEVMMRQCERWYDIRVKYEGAIPQVTFQGKMDRNVQLSELIRFLKIFGINTRLEGRTLTIAGT